MAILQVAANRHTAVTTSFSLVENAYALTGDGNDAVLGGAKSATREADLGFPDISSAQIPDGSTINSAKIVVLWSLSAVVTGGVGGLTPRVANANAGTETTKTTTTEEVGEAAFTTVPTLAQLRAAETSDTVEARFRNTRGSTNSAMQVLVDYCYLEIDYTAPPAEPIPRYPAVNHQNPGIV